MLGSLLRYRALCMLVVGCALVGRISAQQVIVAREESTPAATASPAAKAISIPAAAKPTSAAVAAKSAPSQPGRAPLADVVVSTNAAKSGSPKVPSVGTTVVKAQTISPKPASYAKPKTEPSPSLVMIARASDSPQSARTAPTKATPVPSAPSIAAASPKPVRPTGVMPAPQTMKLTRVEGPAPEPHTRLPVNGQESASQFLKIPLETAFVKLADGFDFAVGRPDSLGYYKARGFRSHGHLGEDWDGIRGGDTDLRDPIYAIGDGIVVFARDCRMGWGNVIIIRHSYRENGVIKNVDSLYGHCDSILVKRGQVVSRGQQIATMGTAHGLYDAHLHLEVRKNIAIGMSRAKFARDSSNYYDPTQFINAHRRLNGGGNYRVAMNTFVHDSRINWNAVRKSKYSRHRGGTRESSRALKKALAKGN